MKHRVIFAAFLLSLAAPLVAGINSWTTSFPAIQTAREIVLDPSNPATIYAVTERVGGGSPRGVWKTTDGGATWSATELRDVSVRSLAISPGKPTTLYAAVAGRVLRSRDGGASWSPADGGLPSVFRLEVSPGTDGAVYAAGVSGLFRSVDAGMSWSFLGNPVPAGFDGPGDLAIDPKTPSILYLGAGSSGIFKSMDGGMTWVAINSGLALDGFIGIPPINVLAVDPVNPRIIFAGTPVGVFRSANGGDNWLPASNGLGRHKIQALAIDSRSPSTLYAGTFNCLIPSAATASLAGKTDHTLGGDGVYRSVDAGATWAQFNTGLTHRCVYSLAISPDGTDVYAGVFFAGVFGYRFSSPCTPTSNQLCLIDGRFRVTLEATDPRTATSGIGVAIPQGNRHGAFSLPTFTGDPSFPEVVVKMLDATRLPPPLGGSFWVFHTGLTDLQYTLTITDMVSGTVQTYRNNRSDPSNLCGGADTAAFRN